MTENDHHDDHDRQHPDDEGRDEPDQDDDYDDDEPDRRGRKGRRHHPCPEDDPCDDYGEGDDAPPVSGCKCGGHCRCDWESHLPEGSVRRVFEELRKELKVPPACVGAPTTAKDTFSAALDELEKEYEGIAALVKAYREEHCKIDCKLDEAEQACRDLRDVCERLDEGTRECIEKVWYECYEKVEFQLECCCLLERRRRFEALEDCREQARALEGRAQDDFDAVKGFLSELNRRFDDLKALRERAQTHIDANDPEAVCAIHLEYRKVYHRLHVLDLWADRERRCDDGRLRPTPSGCRRPRKVKDRRSWKWYRRELVAALKALLEATYRTYCFEQQWIDAKHCMEECANDLKDFRDNRRDKFILEAQDCGPEEDLAD